MVDRSAIWERECHGFAHYLVGQPPPESVVRHYVRWHERADQLQSERFDRMLVAIARWGRPGLRLADAYAGDLRGDGSERPSDFTGCIGLRIEGVEVARAAVEPDQDA